ncbi:MAG: DUF1624 domain-containing protein [Chlorobi bacterium]|nr:DUF1624 domain-containing protein [Chlorobiota bacterium]
MKSATARLYELDAAKFIAMLLMMTGHVLSALVTPVELDITRTPWSVWHWFRGITAPVFLTISGLLFALTLRRTDRGTVEPPIVRRRALRALQLMGIGYLLVFPARRIYELAFVDDSVWHTFVQVNILQLIAISLLMLSVCAYVCRTHRSFSRAMMVLTAGTALLTPVVHGIAWYDHIPAVLAAYLSYDGGSLFPIFPFAAYMFAGAGLGTLLAEYNVENRRALRSAALFIGAGLIGLGVAGAVLFPSADIYRFSPFGVAIRQGTALLFIVAVSALLPLLRPIQSLLVLFGKQALVVYVLHLILLYGTPWTDSIARWYPNTLSLNQGLAMAAVIIALTLGSIVAYDRVRVYLTSPTALRLVRIGVGVLLGWMLLA